MHSGLKTVDASSLSRLAAWIICVIVSFHKFMPAGVHISQRIIACIAVPVQALGVARVGHDGVGLGEAGEGGVIVSGVVKVQAKGKSK